MTETNFFLQIKLLSSSYSAACTQVQLEIAFMRKTVQALPLIDVEKHSLCISFQIGKKGEMTVPIF